MVNIALILDSWDGTIGLRRFAMEMTQNILSTYGNNNIYKFYLFYSKLDSEFENNLIEQIQNLNNVYLCKINSIDIPRYKYWRQLFILKYQLTKYDLDIVFDYYQMSIFFTPGGKYKKWVYVHDICPLFYTNIPFFKKMNICINYKIILNFILKHADIIFVPSYHTKKMLKKYYKIDSNVHIVNEYFLVKKRIKITDDSIISNYMQTNNISPYKFKILIIASDSPIENIESSIGAVSIYNQFYDDAQLIIIGNIKEKLLINFLNKYKVTNFIFLGYVPETDLNIIYSLSNVLLYSSLCEGYGLPPLEAISCGLPVIASNNSSIPEICGKGALYVNPCNIEMIKEKIDYLAHNKEALDTLIKTGVQTITDNRIADGMSVIMQFIKSANNNIKR